MNFRRQTLGERSALWNGALFSRLSILAAMLTLTTQTDASNYIDPSDGIRYDLPSVCNRLWREDPLLISICEEDLFLAQERYSVRNAAAEEGSGESDLLDACYAEADASYPGSGPFDWVKVDDCYLVRSNPHLEEFSNDQKGVPWNAVRYVCAKEHGRDLSAFEKCFRKRLNGAQLQNGQVNKEWITKARWSVGRLCLPLRKDNLLRVLCEPDATSRAPYAKCAGLYFDLEPGLDRIEERSKRRNWEAYFLPSEQAACEAAAENAPNSYLHFPILEACYIGRQLELRAAWDKFSILWLDMVAVSQCDASQAGDFDRCLSAQMRAGRSVCYALSRQAEPKEHDFDLPKALYVCGGLARIGGRSVFKSAYDMRALVYCIEERRRELAT